MKHKKWILPAVMLFAGVSLSVQSLPARERPFSQQLAQAVQLPPSTNPSQGMAGMSAADIKAAKQALVNKGLNPGPMDGTLDSQTQQALRQFQQANKLPVTGTLDQQTAEKLGITAGVPKSAIPNSRGGMQ